MNKSTSFSLYQYYKEYGIYTVAGKLVYYRTYPTESIQESELDE
jgi:hypothetical protein